MLKATTWILISDASRARLFASEGEGRPMKLVQSFEHPASRATNQELVSDRPGRTQQSAAPAGHGPGGGGASSNRSAMEPMTTPKMVEHEHFARELADALYKGMTSNAYSDLVLAAPPQFLGTLREVLEEPVRKRVTVSLDKDYTQLDERTLGERLQAALGSAAPA